MPMRWRRGQILDVYMRPFPYKIHICISGLNNVGRGIIQPLKQLVEERAEKAMATHSSTLAWKIP